MGAIALWFQFAGDPPSAEQIDEALHIQTGEDCLGYRREGHELMILPPMDGYTAAYAIKVLRDLGGTLIDHDTRERVDSTLAAFVEKPWFEHDEATRQAVTRAFKEATGQR